MANPSIPHDDPAGDHVAWWAKLLMRAGYAGRGIVYLAVGALTLLSALGGGDGETTTSALVRVRDMPVGTLVIVAVAVALLCYALWRFANAAFDLDRYGTDAKGIVSRAAMVVVGIVHLGLASIALSVATGRTGGDGESGVDAMTQAVLSLPFGRWLVGAAGLCVIGAGLYFLREGWSEDYHEKLRGDAPTERLGPIMRFGLAAHGFVIAFVGAFLVLAAWHFDADRAGGMGQAFDAISNATAGRWLLSAVAIGFVGFAIVCFVQAIYRVIPTRPREAT